MLISGVINKQREQAAYPEIGLMHFNPSKRHSDHGFCILIDAGIQVIISGFTNPGTRWYAKKGRKRQGLTTELSMTRKKRVQLAKPS